MDQNQNIFDLNINYVTLGGMIKRRASDAESHWDKKYDLKKNRENNRKIYTGEYVKKKIIDDRYQEIFNDNRIHIAVNALVSFVTSRMAEPEVIPSGSKDLERQFALDFEKFIFQLSDQINGIENFRLGTQDLLIGQRVAVLKLVYNAQKKKIELKHLDPASVIIGKRSKLYEEPDLVQETQKWAISKLLTLFPDKRDVIFRLFDIQRGVPSQLEREVEIKETHLFVDDAEGKNQLAVAWSYGNTVFGAMVDPLWDENGNNVIDEPMMPYIFINYLNDGSGYIDWTSPLEQALYSQRNYDKRGQTIEENAAYAGVGVPVFAKGAIQEEAAAKVQFNPVTRLMLDTDDISKAFTVWQAGQMQPFIIEDKADLRSSVDNHFGVNALILGAQAESKTAAQDAMLRDQAQGRLQTLVDAVETACVRYYNLLAQFIVRYMDEDQTITFLGENGQFESVVMGSKKLQDYLGIRIRVKAGTSYPVDRTQKRQVAIELMNAKKIGTLQLYKELGIENPEQVYHEYLQENLLPFAQLEDSEKAVDSREAQEDLAIVIGGEMPEEREDIDNDYLNYLNEYLMTNKYHQLPLETQQRVSLFIADVVAQAQRKVLKMENQQDIMPESGNQMPPIRPKISISGKDLQPDVLAQVVENAGYKPSALTPVEMAAGIMTPPSERINQKTLSPSQQAKPNAPSDSKAK